MRLKKIMAAFISAGAIIAIASLTSLADSTGWSGSDIDGWRYYTSDNVYVKEDWKQIGGVWYYFTNDGYAITDNWAFIAGKLYHFAKNGSLDTNKWIDCGSYTYDSKYVPTISEYFKSRNWRYVGSNGAAYTGWHQIGGKWYWFEDGRTDYYDKERHYGLVHYGYFEDSDGSLYNFDPNGQMRANCWYQGFNDDWWYFGSNGAAYDGWHKMNGKWYHFDDLYGSPKCMMTGVHSEFETGDIFLFDRDGAMLTGWQTFGARWYYADENGYCYRSKWHSENGKWYYFADNGRMVENVTDYYIAGRLYSFDSKGVCTNPNNPKQVYGWVDLEKGKCDYYPEFRTAKAYVGSNGVEYREKWLKSDGYWYYFNKNGIMYADYKTIMIDGDTFDFEDDGKCLNHDKDYRGWYKETSQYGTSWYYYDDNGKVYTGWHKISGNWYYFYKIGTLARNGAMELDELGDGCIYRFLPTGELVTGWYKVRYTTSYSYTEHWTYSGSDGKIYRNRWLCSGGKWYYFDELGKMVESTSDYLIGDLLYDFDSNGICTNPSGRVQKTKICYW